MYRGHCSCVGESVLGDVAGRCLWGCVANESEVTCVGEMVLVDVARRCHWEMSLGRDTNGSKVLRVWWCSHGTQHRGMYLFCLFADAIVVGTRRGCARFCLLALGVHAFLLLVNLQLDATNRATTTYITCVAAMFKAMLKADAIGLVS